MRKRIKKTKRTLKSKHLLLDKVFKITFNFFVLYLVSSVSVMLTLEIVTPGHKTFWTVLWVSTGIQVTTTIIFVIEISLNLHYHSLKYKEDHNA